VRFRASEAPDRRKLKRSLLQLQGPAGAGHCKILFDEGQLRRWSPLHCVIRVWEWCVVVICNKSSMSIRAISLPGSPYAFRDMSGWLS
jgi:hypothetical protein